MTEMDTQYKDEDAVNARLFGNDVKEVFDESNVIIPYNTKVAHKMTEIYNNLNKEGKQ